MTLKFLLTSSFYPPFHLGGDAVHVKYLASELAKLGHEVHVMHSLDAYRIKKQPDREQGNTDGVHTHAIASPFNSSAYSSYLFGNSDHVNRVFSRLIKEIRPDVVHHHNVSLLGYSLFKKQGNYLNLHTAHDYWLFCQENNLMKYGIAECRQKSCFQCALRTRKPRQLWRYLPRFQEAIGELDLVVAPSKFMFHTLRNEFHDMHLAHIANFVPRPHEKTNDKTEPFFVYVGVLERHKGLIPLMENYMKYVKREGALKLGLKIIGTGSLHEYILRFIRENGLEDCVSVLGQLPSVWKDLARGIALVMPSICPENAPLVALESISVGTPMIGADIGGVPEIVDAIDHRLLFSWKRTMDFERALDFAYENRKQLGFRALHAYADQFSPEKYLQRYFEAIDTLDASFPHAG